jgi:adenine specific DNA methylase Mod
MGRFLLNTIFGKDNFVNEIIWRKRAGGGNDSKFIANEHDNILFFAKNINFLKTNGFKRELAKYKYDNGYYLIKPLNDTSLQDSKGLHYDIKLPNGKILEGDKHQWKISKSTFDKYLKENKIIFKEKSVYYKHYIDIQKDLLPPSIFYNQGFNATGTRDLKELDLYNFSKNKPTSKPEKLLIKLIDIGSNENDFIIDFFMGFGSTISTAHKLKRKWLGVEMGEHFETIVLPRMKKVLAGVIVGISKELEKEKRLNKGGFFKYYSLEQYENILKKAEYKNNIKTSPLLGLKGIKIKENNAYYTFERIYPDKKIDLAETISNLLGEKIIKITKDKIYLESKEIDLNNLTFANYPELKSLIYWGESYA